jgi:hypothetical protein
MMMQYWQKLKVTFKNPKVKIIVVTSYGSLAIRKEPR